MCRCRGRDRCAAHDIQFVAAVPPKLTVAPARKPVPVMVTAVPPAAGPVLGAIEVTVGAGLATLCAARKVAICITQAVLEEVGAVAL